MPGQPEEKPEQTPVIEPESVENYEEKPQIGQSAFSDDEAPVTVSSSLAQSLIFSGDDAFKAACGEIAGRELAQNYKLGKPIGHGGCAVVFEAWRKSDDMHVVIKVLHANAPMNEEEATNAVRRFIREAELISSLDEPHIVKCVDYGAFDGAPCMVLEFVDGLALDQLLTRYDVLPLAFATGIIDQLLCALAETHAKGIIHRDIKPSNIMVFDSPPPFEIRVLDFGIASVIDNFQAQALMTQAGNVRGTPSYMAPELFTGDVHASIESDLYAVGLVYLECLTGHPAVLDDNFMRIAYKQVNEPLVIPELVPPGIAAIIQKLCAKAVVERYHSAQSVLDDIHANIDLALKQEDKYLQIWKKAEARRKNPSLKTRFGFAPDLFFARFKKRILILASILLVCLISALILFSLLARPAPQPIPDEAASPEKTPQTPDSQSAETPEITDADAPKIDNSEPPGELTPPSDDPPQPPDPDDDQTDKNVNKNSEGEAAQITDNPEVENDKKSEKTEQSPKRTRHKPSRRPRPVQNADPNRPTDYAPISLHEL